MEIERNASCKLTIHYSMCHVKVSSHPFPRPMRDPLLSTDLILAPLMPKTSLITFDRALIAIQLYLGSHAGSLG